MKLIRKVECITQTKKYNQKSLIPYIRLKAIKLAEYGFNIKQEFSIKYEINKITIERI